MNSNVRVPPALEAVVRKCMSKSAEGRYSTMEEVLSALKQVSGLTQTMSGEFRAADLSDLSRSVELPLPPHVQLRGDLLSGGNRSSMIPLDGVTRGSMGPFGTPANGQMFGSNTQMGNTLSGPTLTGNTLVDQAFPRGQETSAKANRGLLYGGLALAALIVLGGGLMFRGAQRGAPAEPSAKAEPREQANRDGSRALGQPGLPGAERSEATGGQAPPVTTAAQVSVLVSLRSTPAGAMVAVGEREYGPTPTQIEWTGADAQLGREVTFRFYRKGYRDLTVTRQIRGGLLEVDAPPMDPVVAAPKQVVRRPAAPSSPPVVAPSAPVTPLKGYKAEPY
jgi:serine/threonine-protein kinase